MAMSGGSSIASPVKLVTSARAKKSTSNHPFCDFVNVELLDSMGVSKSKATILLEQPVDQNALNKSDLIKLVGGFLFKVFYFDG